jgi:RecB family exonuclease
MWAFGETRPYSSLENGARSQFKWTETQAWSAFSPLTRGLDLKALGFESLAGEQRGASSESKRSHLSQ